MPPADAAMAALLARMRSTAGLAKESVKEREAKAEAEAKAKKKQDAAGAAKVAHAEAAAWVEGAASLWFVDSDERLEQAMDMVVRAAPTRPPAAAPEGPPCACHTEALRHRAAASLSATFQQLTAKPPHEFFKGRRWVQHFEEWMWAQRSRHRHASSDPVLPELPSITGDTATRPGEQPPASKRFKGAGSRAPPPAAAWHDPALRRKLVAAGADDRTASVVLKKLAVSASKAAASVRASAEAFDGGHRGRDDALVKCERITVGEGARQRTKWRLACSGVTLEIHESHLAKLRLLWSLQRGAGDGELRFEEAAFRSDAFRVLCRYAALQGGGQTAGGGFQAALYPSAFRVLRERFGVYCECFASPLNSHFPCFASACEDTDRAFGSFGSFFGSFSRLVRGPWREAQERRKLKAEARGAGSTKKRKAGGSSLPALWPPHSFEANPPFEEATVAAMAKRMERLLSEYDASGLMLQFAVFIPHWGAEKSDAWEALHTSSHLTAHISVPSVLHGYTEGNQHTKANMRAVSSCDSSIFILQTRAAREQYDVGASSDAVAALLAAMRPGPKAKAAAAAEEEE